MSDKNIEEIGEEISSLTLAEAQKLITILDEKYGIKPAAAQVVAGPNSAESATEGGAAKTSFTVKLTACGDNKINVIKALKEILNLPLGEAKTLTEKVPAVIKENTTKEEAESFKKKLEAAGATVSVE